MSVQMKGKRIIGAVKALTSEQTGIVNVTIYVSSNKSEDGYYHGHGYVEDVSTVSAFESYKVIKITKAQGTGDNTTVTFDGKSISVTTRKSNPSPVPYLQTVAVTVLAVDSFSKLNLGELKSGETTKQLTFDIDHLNYTIDKTSKTCTIKGLKKGDTTTKLYLPGKVIYRDSTTSELMLSTAVTIYSKAFYLDTGLTSVIIGNGVTNIGRYAFDSCSGLVGELKIPDSVTSIGDGAFDSCSGLTSVIIGNGETPIGSEAFYNCKGLTSVIIGNGVKSIGQKAFMWCSGLTSITIPDSVTSIRGYAFYGCSGLTSVIIGNGVTSIGDSAFYNCSGLTSITIGNSVTSIGDFAFYKCSGFTSITIPDSVTSIRSNAFQSCDRLKNVYITDLAAWCQISGLNNLMGYGSKEKNLYLNDELIINLTIPHGVTRIGSCAFRGCIGLTSVTIPNSVTDMEFGAFYDCRGLTSVTIPDSVTSIGNSAFFYCSKLTEFIYKGTKGQWIAITKGSSWDYNTGNYVVHCTDGDIAKS